LVLWNEDDATNCKTANEENETLTSPFSAPSSALLQKEEVQKKE